MRCCRFSVESSLNELKHESNTDGEHFTPQRAHLTDTTYILVPVVEYSRSVMIVRIWAFHPPLSKHCRRCHNKSLYFTYLQTKTPRYLHSHLANSSNFNCQQPDLFTFWCLSGVRGPADTEDWLQVDVSGYSTWWQVCKVLHLYPPCQLTTTDLCRYSHLKKFPHCNLCGNQHWRCLKKVYTFVAKTRN